MPSTQRIRVDQESASMDLSNNYEEHTEHEDFDCNYSATGQHGLNREGGRK